MAEENINFLAQTISEKHFAQTDKQLADMRKENAEFDDMNSFKSEINT